MLVVQLTACPDVAAQFQVVAITPVPVGPNVGAPDTVSPTGTGSVTTTAAVVAAVPALLTARVNVADPFCATVFVAGVFRIDRTGTVAAGTVTTAEEVCGAVVSPPPFTVAVFV